MSFAEPMTLDEAAAILGGWKGEEPHAEPMSIGEAEGILACQNVPNQADSAQSSAFQLAE